MFAGRTREGHEKRLEEIARKLLRKVGVDKGMTVLDFGCGSGSYTIPAAKLVGEGGGVFALDKDKTVLDDLMRKARSKGLRNAQRIETSGKLKIDLREDSVDVVLLYDVFHDYYFPRRDERRRLLDEVYRVLKPGGVLSVYPKHVELEKIKAEIEGVNFNLEREHSGILIHDDKDLERSLVLNFRKKLGD